MYRGGLNNRIAFNTVAFISSHLTFHSPTAIRIGDYSAAGELQTGTLFTHNLVYKNSNLKGSVQYFSDLRNVTDDTVVYNNFWGEFTQDKVINTYLNGDSFWTVADYTPGTGHTFNNNVQLDPVLEGGELPDALDSNWQPNTPYFALTADTPLAVRATMSPLIGDSVHGYSSDPDKFSTDIRGTVRQNWSMGAYEYTSTTAKAPAAPTNLRKVP